MAGVIDNSFNKVTVKTLHPTFGAEITVANWETLDDATVEEIRSVVDKVSVCYREACPLMAPYLPFLAIESHPSNAIF